jgi:hypothetical protein
MASSSGSPGLVLLAALTTWVLERRHGRLGSEEPPSPTPRSGIRCVSESWKDLEGASKGLETWLRRKRLLLETIAAPRQHKSSRQQQASDRPQMTVASSPLKVAGGLHCGCSCLARRGQQVSSFEQHSPIRKSRSPMTPQSDVALQYPDSVLMKHALRALTDPACLA